MTEPTRDALHAETLDRLRRGIRLSPPLRTYAAECVQRVPELEAEVASHTAYKLSLLDALGPGVPEDEGRSIPDAIRALKAEVERLRAQAAIVDAMEGGAVSDVGRTPRDFPAGKRFGVLTDRQWYFGESVLAAYAAATREGTDAS